MPHIEQLEGFGRACYHTCAHTITEHKQTHDKTVLVLCSCCVHAVINISCVTAWQKQHLPYLTLRCSLQTPRPITGYRNSRTFLHVEPTIGDCTGRSKYGSDSARFCTSRNSACPRVTLYDAILRCFWFRPNHYRPDCTGVLPAVSRRLTEMQGYEPA